MADAINRDILERKMEIFAGAMGGMMNAAVMHVGHRLGLYKGMHGAGRITSRELAAKLGLVERFVREWLYQQAAAGIVEHHRDGKFELLAEAGTLLADETSMVGASLGYLPKMFNDAILSEEAFRTGVGRSFDAGGEENALFVDAVLGIWNRASLVSEALPKLGGVVARLREGGVVADVGCGAGAAPLAVAKAFPRAAVHGYDTSAHALSIGAAKAAEVGARNVTFHNPDDDPLPHEPTFDLVMTIDSLHDMTRPDLVAAAVRRAIKPDGVWFIVDIDGASPPEANISRPGAEMLFAMSLSMCLQASTASPDGLALGAVGLPEPAIRELVAAAGFSRFRRVPGLEHPSNAFYEVRP